MTTTNETAPTISSSTGLPARVLRALRFLSSLKLAVSLIVALAAVLAWATILEADKGAYYAQWYVYDSTWFIGLLTLLGINIFAAALIRYPWKRKQTGFVIAHAGLLVLLCGSVQTFLFGIEGQLTFEEGETADAIQLADRSQLRVIWRDGPFRGEAARVTFQPGPADWPQHQSLFLGNHNGARIDAVKYFRHARSAEQWIADEIGLGGPAVQFALVDPQGKRTVEDWLAVSQFGAEKFVGPAKLELQRAPVQTMLEDFLNPPFESLGAKGVLSVHFQERIHHLQVDDNIGKTCRLAEFPIAVEIGNYLPNAEPGEDGRFVSRGERPKNPLLELLVRLPGKDRPIRQIAFAKHPLLNFDGIHGRECPVKFWFHHPGVSPMSGIQFLQTPDVKLYCRIASGGSFQPRGEVKKGDSIDAFGQYRVQLTDYLPHARKESAFIPVTWARGETDGPGAAALFEVRIDGSTQRVWLKHGDPLFGSRSIATPNGTLDLTFENASQPLGFSLQLIDFERSMNPGRVGNASFKSKIRLVDRNGGIDEERWITMNEPLSHGSFTFYQSSFRELPNDRAASVLSVAYDPGRFLKYLGSILICSGITVMFYMRAYFFRTTSVSRSDRLYEGEQQSQELNPATTQTSFTEASHRNVARQEDLAKAG